MKKTLSSLLLIVTVVMLQAQEKTIVKHVFAPLPYAYNALEKAIDAQTMEIHYDRHHRAYYTNFLKAIEGTDFEYLILDEIFQNTSTLPAAVRNNAGGYYNHEFFWNSISPNGGGSPDGALKAAIERDFGSFDAFKTTFEKAAATRFGSGWAWLSTDSKGKLFVSSTPNQDNPLMDVSEQQGTPLLALDVWEHAYYLRYQNKRATYATAFWEVVNWSEAGERYENALAK